MDIWLRCHGWVLALSMWTGVVLVAQQRQHKPWTGTTVLSSETKKKTFPSTTRSHSRRIVRRVDHNANIIQIAEGKCWRRIVPGGPAMMRPNEPS
jgi:hypothetical protein